MARISLDERRESYLDIGCRLLEESYHSAVPNAGLALSQVKLADVADRCGVTKGALYHLWDSQEQYWDDLLSYLVQSHTLFGVTELRAAFTEIFQEDGPPPTVRKFANAIFDSLSTSQSFVHSVSLYSYLADQEVHDSFVNEFEGSIALETPILEAVISETNRKLVEPHTMVELVVAMSALLQGLCLQRRLGEERTADLATQGEGRLTLFAAGVEALILSYTEPQDPTADKPVHPADTPEVLEVALDFGSGKPS
ncbi:transcriptional regulator, TetR family [Actinobacteria bacterium IMCC26207]|nr:transcriptional regulator, TetR family [Actinobacteria bacterium IMCC26207]